MVFAATLIAALAAGMIAGPQGSPNPNPPNLASGTTQTVVVDANNTAVMGASPGTTVTVTRQWVNVPNDFASRGDVQRWSHLR
jgi:hypothetical protein